MKALGKKPPEFEGAWQTEFYRQALIEAAERIKDRGCKCGECWGCKLQEEIRISAGLVCEQDSRASRKKG